MSPLRHAGRRRAARLSIALAAAVVLLGAALALAAGHHGRGDRGGRGKGHAGKGTRGHGGTGAKPAHRQRLLRPTILEGPPPSTEMSDPQFRFHVAPRATTGGGTETGSEASEPRASTRSFRCTVDGGDWFPCDSPYRLTGLRPGTHSFAVRVLNGEGRIGEPVEVSWLQAPPPSPPASAPTPTPTGGEPVAADDFAIEALVAPEGLYPGFPATPIPVRITNPNPEPIEVTELRVEVGAAPESCGAENFEVTPADIPVGEPVQVPGGGSVELPSVTVAAPSIRMLDLPVDQDACQEAQIPLVFSAEAQG